MLSMSRDEDLLGEYADGALFEEHYSDEADWIRFFRAHGVRLHDEEPEGEVFGSLFE